MTTPSLQERVEVETPELVVLSYDIAGVGSRVAAAVIDLLIVVVCSFALSLFAARMVEGLPSYANVERATGWALAVVALIQFIALWAYYVLFEALADGRTPGKRLMHLRVVRDGGLSVTFGASAVRNLLRLLDLQPGIAGATGIISMILNREGKRLGDIIAGTLVVREQVLAPLANATPVAAAPTAARAQAELTDAEFDVLDRFAERRAAIDPQRRSQFAAQLAQRFAAALVHAPEGTPLAKVMWLHTAERAARAQGASVRSDVGAARERHAIVATNAPRWNAFAARLAVAQKGGLRSLGEQGVREFVAEYRELTADLARLRTATRGGASSELFYLNRLVSSAHNLLYRRRTIRPTQVLDFLLVAVPTEIRRSSSVVMLAALLLFAPMIATGVTVARNPDAALIFLPPSMLDRAEEGVRAAERGDGYVDIPSVYRPTAASRILANNVQVAFNAFAAGATAGVLTCVVLVTNGLSIGAVLGLYESKGILSLIAAFIAPHGVLELFAICLAGAAGLLVGAGMLLPGDRTRRRAIVENARRAIVLVAGAALLLCIAGPIEGFISPIPWWPLELKLSFSAVTAVLLYVYLRQGARVRSRLAPSVPDTD
ncbi:MAG: stage II sporulation protein M [Gemmatimonadaceae bacterium]|nr:stage II sporulation protein M [Gemmatimonadaceae bacterium]